MALRARLSFLALAVLLVLTASRAAMADPVAPSAQPSPPEEVWYGAPMLVFDGAALALIASGDGPNMQLRGATPSTASRAMIAAGFGAFLVGPPAIHFAHHRANAGITSLMARLLVPGAVGVLSVGLGVPPGNDAAFPIALAAVSMGVVALFDDFTGAYEPPTRSPAPSLAIGPLGVAGTF
jgi:hypothetical protein